MNLKLNLAIFLGLLAAITVTGLKDLSEKSASIQSGVLRLHILANSDDDVDQELKLKVRDRILEHSSELFTDANDSEQAKQNAKENLERITEIAQETVDESGFSYKVQCNLLDMPFPSRQYGNLTVPVGEYHAIQVLIGEADGENWWCVMYPPLCLPACAESDAAAYFSEGEYDVLANPQKYEVRFKILEVFSNVKSFFKSA